MLTHAVPARMHFPAVQAAPSCAWATWWSTCCRWGWATACAGIMRHSLTCTYQSLVPDLKARLP